MPEALSPETPASKPPRRGPSGFGGDVLKLASGTTVAQIITLGTAPILTRMFSPAAFGDLAIFTALSGVLIAVVCLRYEDAVILPKTEDEAAGLVSVAVMAAVAMSGFYATVCLLFAQPIQDALHWSSVRGWPWLVALSTFLGGITSTLVAWHSRKRRFGRVSWARVIGSAASSSYQLGAGALGQTTAAGLVNGAVSGYAVTAVVLGAQLGGDDRHQLLAGRRLRAMLGSAKRYRKFPLFSVWSSLLNSLSWQLPALLLGFYFGSAIVGFYALGFRILQLPMSLVGTAIGQVFFPRAARAKHEGQLAEVVRGVYAALLDFGLLPMAVIGVAAPDIFSAILGQQWNEAGVYAQILAPWTLVWFVSSPLLSLYNVLELQGLGLWMNALIFGSRLASLVIGGLAASARLAIALFSGSGVLVYGFVALVVMSRSGVKPGMVLPQTARKLLSVVPPCAVLLCLESLHVASWVTVLVGAAFVLAKWALLFLQYRAGRMGLPASAGH